MSLFVYIDVCIYFCMTRIAIVLCPDLPGAYPGIRLQVTIPPATMVITVPAGVGPGMKLQVRTPDGRAMLITVPHGEFLRV